MVETILDRIGGFVNNNIGILGNGASFFIRNNSATLTPPRPEIETKKPPRSITKVLGEMNCVREVADGEWTIEIPDDDIDERYRRESTEEGRRVLSPCGACIYADATFLGFKISGRPVCIIPLRHLLGR